MKLFKNVHIISVIQVPMNVLASSFYNRVRKTRSDQESRLLREGFVEGYKAALLDAGVKLEHHPKGKRE